MDYAPMKTKNSIGMQTVGYGGCFVHNVLGTKDEPIPEGYTSFLDYWEKKSGQSAPPECPVKCAHQNQDGSDADKKDIVGAHVRIDEISCPDDWAWIVPLCKHCNSDDNSYCIELPAGTVLVPIKMSKSHPVAKHEMDEWVKNLKKWGLQ